MLGAFVLIAAVPKEVWIGLGVLGGIGLVGYLAIKLFASKADRKVPISHAKSSAHEPTLAELTARDPQPPRKPSRATAASTTQSTVPADPRLAKQPTDWIQARSALVEESRQRAQTLRDKHPPTPRQSLPQSLPSSTPPTSQAPESSAAVRTNDPQREAFSGQSDAWKAGRQTVADANRQRASYLRSKFQATQWQVPERRTAENTASENPNLADQPPSTGDIPALSAPDAPQSTSIPLPAMPSPRPPQERQSQHRVEKASESTPERSLGDFMRLLRRGSETEEFFSVPTSAPRTPFSQSYTLPPAPAGVAETRWLKSGETIDVAGRTLPGGMLYIGPKLKAFNGMDEPALINPHLKVARQGDFRKQHTNYWPSYADISPEGRAAYLSWLSEGRSHPDCDIGLVFLFFYGLERRVIADSRDDAAARDDWPAIVAELRRLLAIYGEKSGSFQRYAGELLSWIELDCASGQLYKQPVPELPRTYELPPYVRLALGQAAVDRAPLTAQMALAWVRLSPEIYLRTAAIRCPDEFARLFAQRYHEVLGPGLLLPKNRTKLKFVYQAASAGLRGSSITLAFGDIPDVTALTAPIKKLAEIVTQCTEELGSYSRLVGKDPSAASGLEGLLLLPATLWPPAAQAKLQTLTARMRDGRLSLPLQELLETFGGAKQPVNRDRIRGLARALEGAEIGFEPHVLVGARAPGERDAVVLFAQPFMDSAVGSGAEYQIAALTLQLASAMAQSDGDFNEREVAHLRAEIEGWAHLTPAERRRLQAHLQWLTASPPTLAGMKKKLEPLPATARETLAAFMATLAQSDGFVSPDEVKFLEKVYKALGVETKRVFSDVHAIGAGSAPVSVQQAEKQGFRLDADRIAALQEDTAKVSALLSKIFTEEAVGSAAPPPAAAPEPEPEDEVHSPLRLDEAHSALLRLLLSRPEWTRSELEDAAADLDLMLDGALEQINEAAFDAFDEPLCEGDNPLTVNTELLEKIEA